VTIPLAIKLSPYCSSLAYFAHRLVAAGADGLVLFNRSTSPSVSHASVADPSAFERANYVRTLHSWGPSCRAWQVTRFGPSSSR
jgi:hypothetical protein